MKKVLIGIMCWMCVVGCDSADVVNPEEEQEQEIVDLDTPDWTEETHAKSADPNYEIVFPDDEVLRMDIEISADDWASMQADLAANLSGGGGRGPVEIDFTPIWVPAKITFLDKDWYKVGIRYKGNSTLMNAYQSGTAKFPFKLDFDEFEDTYPAIENQRFYGFKQLNLSNNDSDASCMREKISADLFREFGVPAARTSFCEVYLDRGNGSEFIGIYTIVEEVDDTVAASQFEDKNGNLYKPDGTGATFAWGSYSEVDLDKKSNEDEVDFSDVKSFYDLLHHSNRTENPALWKSDLEALFDVDGFLKYLAVNNVIENWDTYGNMTHNYFLYNDQGRMTWIPWDNNEAMQDGKMGGSLSLSMSEVSSEWPIIRYVMDVADYKSQYEGYLGAFVTQVFEPTQMKARYSDYEALLSSYATQENVNITAGVNTLKSHVDERNQLVQTYLGVQ